MGSNMFVVVVLQHLQKILNACYPTERDFMAKAQLLEEQINEGIAKYGVVQRNSKSIYAYEVDGCGNYILMDDANVPSLLSMDYLGYSSPYDETGRIKQDTMKFLLSPDNPFYFS